MLTAVHAIADVRKVVEVPSSQDDHQKVLNQVQGLLSRPMVDGPSPVFAICMDPGRRHRYDATAVVTRTRS